jgi:glyoxylase-like metal-dependent hydrolase (beta-lactamase superfamily II)
MKRIIHILTIALLSAGCSQGGNAGNEANAQQPANAAAPAQMEMALSRIDCGRVDVADFTGTFSDNKAYPPGPKQLASSCYLIRHGDTIMIWDTGFSPELKGKKHDMGGMVASLDRTLPEQLVDGGLTPADVDVLGISHSHGDHTGQAKLMPAARLVIGKADFDGMKGKKDDPFGPWRGPGAKVTAAAGDLDIFGDGTVVAYFLPGHTPGHMALLVRLKSGPVFLSGDVAHAHETIGLKAVPIFNTDRAQSIASMERFEKVARETGAKVVIQHELDDIAKVPGFPRAAK